MDIGILLWLQEHVRSEVLTVLMRFITSLGDIGFIWILIGLVLALKKKYRTTGFLVLAALLLEWLLVNCVIKELVMRIRPFEAHEALKALISHPDSFSFPSGHTGSSFAAASVMWKRLPRRFSVPCLLLAVLIAFSRLYVGVHYPTDVLAGAVIGVLIGLTCCRIWDARETRRKHPPGIPDAVKYTADQGNTLRVYQML